MIIPDKQRQMGSAIPKVSSHSEAGASAGHGLALTIRKYAPGLALVGLITAAAFALRHIPFLSDLSPMIIGIVLGVAVGNITPLPAIMRPGVHLAGKSLLRLAVALLGLQVTLGQLVGIGPWGLFSVVIVLFGTFFFTLWLGRLMAVPAPLATLIAAGTSVCGAAAIAGANSAIRAPDEDVTYAVASITFFGTLAMLFYPLIGHALGLGPDAYGTWIGLSVHEVAQVVGAGFQGGEEAGRVAVITKLARVLLLAVLVFGLALRHGRTIAQTHSDTRRPPLVPVFVLGFLGLCILNSLELVPEAPRGMLIAVTPVLLTASLSALGIGTHFNKLRELGIKPLLLCAAASAMIAILSLVLATV